MKTTLIIILFFSIQLYGQSTRINEFSPLNPIDTLINIDEIDQSEQIDSLDNNDFFFTYKDDKYQSGLLLKKRVKEDWVVYDFESEFVNASNIIVESFQKINDRFVTIQVYRTPSGECSSNYGILILLNIETCKTITFWNYSFVECYNEFEDVTSTSECKADIIISDENGIIISTKKSEVNMSCVESAEFKIVNNQLIKTKYYLENTEEYYPVRRIGNIYTGMNITELKKELPNAIFKKARLYKYGSDSDRAGFEVIEDGEVLFFAIVTNETVVKIILVSNQFKFSGIDTDTTIDEVFDRYPDAKLHIDLINDWEYIYLDKEKVTLIFKTNGTNRIGIYDSDPEDSANGINRQDVKIDLIEI